MFLGELQNHRGQQEHGDQVGDGHEAVEGIADAPDQAKIHGCTQDGHQGIGNVEGQQNLASQQEFRAAGTVQTPAHDGGEGEAAQGNGGENGNPVAVNPGKAADGQLRTGSLAVGNLHTAEENDQGGHGADDDGIHEDLEDAEHALLDRISGVGAGMGNGAGTEACLIGENAAGDTLLHTDKEAAHHTAGDGSRPEGALENGHKHSRNPVDPQDDQADAQKDVQQGHDGHQSLRNLANALDTANEDQRHDDADEHADDQVTACGAVHAQQAVVDQGGIDGSGDGIDLGGIAGAEDRADTEEGIQICQPHPLAAQTVLDVVHGAAHIVALLVPFPEIHRQGNFGELGAHAQQGGDPHPEHSTGAADGNGTCHAGNVAGANGCGQSGTHRLERSQGTAGGSGFVKNTANGTLHGIAKLPQLQEAAADTQVQTHADDAGHGGNTPDKAIQKVIDLCDDFDHNSFPLLFFFCEISKNRSYYTTSKGKSEVQKYKCFPRKYIFSQKEGSLQKKEATSPVHLKRIWGYR